jgi:hypothetical protein
VWKDARLTARLRDLLQNRLNLCDLRLHGERVAHALVGVLGAAGALVRVFR